MADHDEDMHQLQRAAGWVLLVLIVFVVIARPDTGMVATLIGGLATYLGLRYVGQRRMKDNGGE